MQIKWVILLFVVACPVAAKPQPQLRWGGFELIGATLSQRQWVSSQLLLDEQGAIEPQLFEQGPTFCAALRQRFSREIRCEIVGYQNQLYFVVNFLPDTQAVYQDLRKLAKVPMSAKVLLSATADLPCTGVCGQATERLAAWRTKHGLEPIASRPSPAGATNCSARTRPRSPAPRTISS